MSRSVPTVADWKRAVFKDKHLSDSTRVLLLYLADHMNADLTVSVSREKVAKDLGRSERRLADKFREAIGEKPPKDEAERRRNFEERLLDRIVRGQKHVQAVYKGLVPSAVTMTPARHCENTSQGDGNPHAENAENRHGENGHTGPQQDPWGSRPIRADLSVNAYDHDVGSNGEPCRWHGFAPCPETCPDHGETREESS